VLELPKKTVGGPKYFHEGKDRNCLRGEGGTEIFHERVKAE